MKKLSLIFCGFIMMFISSFTCGKDDNCHYTADFINKTDKTVYIMASSGYPDTNAWKYLSPDPLLSPEIHEVKANSNNDAAMRGRTCVEVFLSNPETDTLILFVFDAQVLETTPWDTVKARNLYLTRYDLSLPDLQNNNWTITYP
jgi:hypothetical protein